MGEARVFRQRRRKDEVEVEVGSERKVCEAPLCQPWPLSLKSQS